MSQDVRTRRWPGHVEAVIRGDPALTVSGSEIRTIPRLILTIAVFGFLYGAAMGGYGGVFGDRSRQILYAGIKVPLLLIATFLVSLPSFAIFNMLAGLGADFRAALRSLLAGQAGLTVVLASLAPFTVLWNVSDTSHDSAVLFDAIMFGTATIGGQILLRRHYRALVARHSRHRAMLIVWGITYTFVGIQMGWTLRPFVGEAGLPVSFFRPDSWGNAYLMVLKLVHNTFWR